MLACSGAAVLDPIQTPICLCSNPTFNHRNPCSSMPTAFSFFRSFSTSLLLPLHHNRCFLLPTLSPFRRSPRVSRAILRRLPCPRAHLAKCYCASVGNLAPHDVEDAGEGHIWDFPSRMKAESFDFDGAFSSTDLKHIQEPSLDVIKLEELPEQWRRSRLAWLCKELPAHKPPTMIRVLNAQRKWIRQEDATYIAVHCMRIRENETAFRAYKWMLQQHWFTFDFALATKLAQYMGKERKYVKCREIFDNIINQGRVPLESTFHILIVAYLSSPSEGCLEEACYIYSRMIQLGGYKPPLSLHNCLFRALVKKPGCPSKYYLNMAEFVFHNLTTCGLEIHKDIYCGLIWLHSYQDIVDMERIAALRVDLQSTETEEDTEVLLSILRAYSKHGDVEEAERTWNKLTCSGNSLPSQAIIYMMEVHARVGNPMKSLEIFRSMQKQCNYSSVVVYHKIIEVLCKAKKQELAESLMEEFIDSGLKPLTKPFIELMDMYSNLGLHDKLESSFLSCLSKSRPNQIIYNIYLESLVQIGSLEKVEEIFNQMYNSREVGLSARSCNAILSCYIAHGEYVKAEKIYDLMLQKKYDIEPSSMKKLDFVFSLSKRVIKKPISLKLSKEQREVLIGLLLGGLQIRSDEERKNHALNFVFNDHSRIHSILKRHVYDQYIEWLASYAKRQSEDEDIPSRFTTISHSYFGFYADQFFPKGQPMIPKLIHRWLSPRVLGYWYMYGGHRTSSGDVLLKVEGTREGVGRIVKGLKEKSLKCHVKKKGRFFWIGFIGSNSVWFWRLVEPFILEDLRHLLKAGGEPSEAKIDPCDICFKSGYDMDDVVPDCSDVEDL